MDKFLVCAIALTIIVAVGLVVFMGPSATDRARRNCFDAGKMWSQGKCYDRP